MKQKKWTQEAWVSWTLHDFPQDLQAKSLIDVKLGQERFILCPLQLITVISQ